MFLKRVHAAAATIAHTSDPPCSLMSLMSLRPAPASSKIVPYLCPRNLPPR